MIAGLALFLVTQVQPKTVTVFQAPAEKKYAEVKPGGTTILPNGRFLTPIGQRLYTGSDLWNVITDPTGTYAVGLDDSGMVIYNLKTKEKKPLPRKTIAPAGAFLAAPAAGRPAPGSRSGCRATTAAASKRSMPAGWRQNHRPRRAPSPASLR